MNRAIEISEEDYEALLTHGDDPEEGCGHVVMRRYNGTLGCHIEIGASPVRAAQTAEKVSRERSFSEVYLVSWPRGAAEQSLFRVEDNRLRRVVKRSQSAFVTPRERLRPSDLACW